VPGARTAWNLFKKKRFTFGKNTPIADIYWEPCFIPPRNLQNMVTTVHDLSHIRFPEYHPKSRLKSMESLAEVIEASQKILTVSEYSKGEIIDVFGTPADKIIVTHNAPADQYKVLSEGKREPVLKKFGLMDKSYFLSVCTLEPRKNLKTILKAYNLIPRSIQEKFPLVLVGRSGWSQEKNKSFYNKLCPGGNIIFTGYVDASDLPALFGGAKSFVYPSVYEGFGLPPIEAMACGTPVIASDIPVLREVCADVASYASVLCERQWRDRLVESLDLNQDQYWALSARGVSRSKCFSWDSSARKTYDVFEEVNS